LAVVAIHGATFVLLCALPLATSGLAAAGVVIAASAALCCRAYAWRAGRHAIAAIRLHDNRTMELEQRSGNRVACRVLDSTVAGPWLTVIHACPVGERPLPWRMRTVLIVPDMLGAEEFRKLRVLLRLGREDDPPSP
jgi:hypothetical protein